MAIIKQLNSEERIAVTKDQNTLCLKERSSQERNTQNSKFKEEDSSRFYTWGIQWVVV